MPGLEAIRTLLALRRHQHATRQELDRFRDRHLRRVIRHAYDRVPYYRDLFDDAGLEPADIRTSADLQHIPITYRATLQALPPTAFVSRGLDPARLIRSSSGGSTGEPITVHRKWVEARLLATIRARGLRSMGRTRRDRVAILKTLATRTSRDQTRLGRFLAPLRPEAWSVVDSNQPTEAIVDELASVEATILCGYPAQLTLVATEVDPDRLRALDLHFITTGGEVLMPDQRRQMEAAFDAPVRDTYGSTEFDLLAQECPEGFGYHVCDDGLVLEVIHEGALAAEGERGEVVGTCLHAHAMPFIRYAQGDVVRRGPGTCACGSHFSTLRDIQGRIVEYFVKPDGKRVHPYEVFVPIRLACPWIRRFQVTQYSIDHVVMRILPESQPAREALDTVRSMFAETFGPRVRFDLEVVEQFEFGSAGKFQMYRSRVAGGAPGEGQAT